MPKIFTSKTQTIGKLGEDIACRFLVNKNFKIIETNHTKKWGEIDIVAQKDNKIYFVEVKSKTVSRLAQKTKEQIENLSPEENANPIKIDRFMRTIQTYLAEKNSEDDWEALVLAVFIDTENKTSIVRATEIFG